MKKIKNIIKKIIKLFNKKIYIPLPTPIDTNKILENKIVLITGGSGGIGMEMARTFIKSGAKVIISGSNEQN